MSDIRIRCCITNMNEKFNATISDIKRCIDSLDDDRCTSFHLFTQQLVISCNFVNNARVFLHFSATNEYRSKFPKPGALVDPSYIVDGAVSDLGKQEIDFLGDQDDGWIEIWRTIPTEKAKEVLIHYATFQEFPTGLIWSIGKGKFWKT